MGTAILKNTLPAGFVHLFKLSGNVNEDQSMFFSVNHAENISLQTLMLTELQSKKFLLDTLKAHPFVNWQVRLVELDPQ